MILEVQPLLPFADALSLCLLGASEGKEGSIIPPTRTCLRFGASLTLVKFSNLIAPQVDAVLTHTWLKEPGERGAQI